MPIPQLHIYIACASQVGSLRSLSNASCSFTSALPAVASSASQLVSRFSSGGAPLLDGWESPRREIFKPYRSLMEATGF